LNSKERVKAAINHEKTDRVPVSIAGLNLAIKKNLKARETEKIN
jgi:hypothetical protein